MDQANLKTRHTVLLTLCILIFVFSSSVSAINVTVDTSTKFQTIDGFGAHGAMDVWWNAGPFFNNPWLSLVIDTLGLTIDRNEYYPEYPDPDATQPCDFAKQAPFLKALKAKADASNEPLKFQISIWSAPAVWKTNNSDINGGFLEPAHYADYGNYLASAATKYHNAGVDLYVISPQNEPGVYGYNSCDWVPDEYMHMFNTIVPLIRAAGYGTKVGGAEHFLWPNDPNGQLTDAYCYLHMLADSASSMVSMFMIHDYTNDNNWPQYITYWKNGRYWADKCNHVPLWQTEDGTGDRTWNGAMSQMTKMSLSIKYAHLAAWVNWQLGAPSGDEFALICQGDPLDGRFYGFRHWARFVRPGAVAVAASQSSDSNNVIINAFKRTTGASTQWAIEICNILGTSQTVNLSGAGLPAQFDVYQSTAASATCSKLAGPVTTSITVPATSMTTLVSGDFHGGSGTAVAPVNNITKPAAVPATLNVFRTGRSIAVDYTVSSMTPVSIRITTADGRIVARLLDRAGVTPGSYRATWSPDGVIGAGLYFVNASIGSRLISMPLNMLK